MSRWTRVASALLVGALAAAGAWRLLQAADDGTRPGAASIVGTPPTVGPIRDVIIVKGSVAFKQQITLRAQTSGEVSRLTLLEGDPVTSGQSLLRIAAPMEAIDRSIRQVDIERDELRLKAFNREIDGMRRLVDIGGMARLELDQKLLERDAAEKDLERNRLEIDRLAQSREVSVLKSPFKGQILSVAVENGQHVRLGDELMVVAGGGGPFVNAFVDAMDAERLAPGMPVIFSDQEDSERRHRGRIRQIARAALGTQRPNSVKVQIDGDGPLTGLRISQQLYVEIAMQEVSSALRVPRQLVYLDGGRWIAHVVEGDRVVERQVSVGASDATFVQILDGLRTDDRLVSRVVTRR